MEKKEVQNWSTSDQGKKNEYRLKLQNRFEVLNETEDFKT
jgi:hypothetical protein